MKLAERERERERELTLQVMFLNIFVGYTSHTRTQTRASDLMSMPYNVLKNAFTWKQLFKKQYYM